MTIKCLEHSQTQFVLRTLWQRKRVKFWKLWLLYLLVPVITQVAALMTDCTWLRRQAGWPACQNQVTEVHSKRSRLFKDCLRHLLLVTDEWVWFSSTSKSRCSEAVQRVMNWWSPGPWWRQGCGRRYNWLDQNGAVAYRCRDDPMKSMCGGTHHQLGLVGI